MYNDKYTYESRSKLCSCGIGHVQTGWSPIGCEGFEFLEFSLSEISSFQRLFHCDGVLVNPGLLADRVFSLACPGFALRASSFNSRPCVGVSSRCWHSLRMRACSSFMLLLYLPIQKCETGETFNNSWVNFLGTKLQDEIESGLPKCGACPSASMKPYMKGIGRYRLRTPTFYQESVYNYTDITTCRPETWPVTLRNLTPKSS